MNDLTSIPAIKKTIGKNLKHLRTEKQLSSQDLAKKAVISAAYMSKLEAGEANITLDAFLRVALALDIEPGELFSANLYARKPASTLDT